jgi:lipoprotein-anchoring transpeptidase ErfK/SrfK
MFAKLGLLTAVLASVLTFSTTALAGAEGSTTSEPAPPEETEPPTTPPFGPAQTGDQTPTRGTQLQLQPPPPPPTTTTQAPWDPFKLPANSGSGRRAVYSKSQQTVWAFDGNNQLIKAHRVSGRQTPLDPAPGTYSVFSRSRYTYSINNPSITWGYMVRFAHGAQGGNIGFHEIPFQYGSPVQSLSQLGQPLSGGCVRQALPNAIWMWDWAQIGTKVVVLP